MPRLATFLIALVLIGVLALVPRVMPDTLQGVGVLLMVNIMMASSYRLMTLTGDWSFVHVALMGIGAYASAIASTLLGLPVLTAMVLGIVVAVASAALLATLLLRLRGVAFMVGSLAAAEMIRLIWLGFDQPFGGPEGISGLPALPGLPLAGVASHGTVIALSDPANFAYLCLIIVSAGLLVLYRIERSRIGLMFRSIVSQESLASSVGVSSVGYRRLAFVTAGLFAGLAGALYAHFAGEVRPQMFGFEQLAYVLIWVMAGGTAVFYGPILGAVLLTVIGEVILPVTGLEAYKPLVFGAILIAVALWLPGGIAGLIARRGRPVGDHASSPVG